MNKFFHGKLNIPESMLIMTYPNKQMDTFYNVDAIPIICNTDNWYCEDATLNFIFNEEEYLEWWHKHYNSK